jgi:hypothetical protein
VNLERLSVSRTRAGRSNAASGSRTATSLNAAYVHGTSGPAVAVRYFCPTADPISELYVFLDAAGGTLGNVTMEAAIYNENTALRAGTTQRDVSTATAMPAAQDMWVRFTFGTPYTPTVGEILWLVAYNTSAAPTVDFPQILTGTTHDMGDALFTPFTTTNGFSGNGGAASEMPFVVKQGSAYFGQPFTQRHATFYANNTLERGIQITPTEDVTVCAAVFPLSNTLSDLRILADATAPGGAALNTFDLDSDANETTADVTGSKWFDSPVTLTGGTTYKATLTFGSATQNPAVLHIEDYASYSAVFDALRANDKLAVPWGVVDDGAGGWTIQKDVCPDLSLIVSDFPAQAAGGGDKWPYPRFRRAA